MNDCNSINKMNDCNSINKLIDLTETIHIVIKEKKIVLINLLKMKMNN